MKKINHRKPLIYDLDLPELEEILAEWGEPAYRARQIWQGLYQQLWNDSGAVLCPATGFEAKAGGRFHLLTSRSGDSPIFHRWRDAQNPFPPARQTAARSSLDALFEKRKTLCISTQAGCAMGCVFCATGQMGFRRHLSSGEIVEQVLYYARILQAEGERVTNVVVMGMGEPFHNYDATLAAIDRLSHPKGITWGRAVSPVSTVGLVPMIRRFAAERRQVNLAISLHAADDELRSSMLPINKKYPIAELIAACGITSSAPTGASPLNGP
jgi:23S rRNA (adenine2503-C2)-methyltransferase